MPRDPYLDEQAELLARIAPLDCDARTAAKGFAICCGAAAAIASRFDDCTDLGGGLSAAEWQAWGGRVGTLLELMEQAQLAGLLTA